jgi:SAM-dependent methyltransferase
MKSIEAAFENAVATGADMAGEDRCPLCGGTYTTKFLIAPDRFHWRRATYQLARCQSCSGVWLVRPPTPGEMSLHYDEDYHKAITAAGETGAESRWQRQREMIARHKQGGSILDIGCSSGAFLGTMRGDAWKLYGIEMEEATAARARVKTGAEVFVGDAIDAPFPADSFDVIACFDVLEHVYDPRQFLTKVLEWLKPGGIFCTVLPNIDSWESRAFGSYWYGLELPRHLFHFSPRSLRYVMGSLGFIEKYLATNTCYVERSMGYVGSRMVERLGLSPTPASKVRRPRLAWRAVRKLLRVTLVSPFSRVAAAAGAGGSIEAIFAKSLVHPVTKEAGSF